MENYQKNIKNCQKTTGLKIWASEIRAQKCKSPHLAPASPGEGGTASAHGAGQPLRSWSCLSLCSNNHRLLIRLGFVQKGRSLKNYASWTSNQLVFWCTPFYPTFLDHSIWLIQASFLTRRSSPVSHRSPEMPQPWQPWIFNEDRYSPGATAIFLWIYDFKTRVAPGHCFLKRRPYSLRCVPLLPAPGESDHGPGLCRWFLR